MGNLIQAVLARDLPPGKMMSVKLEETGILLANVGGKIYAVNASCTHEEADLAEGTLNGQNVACPFHGSEFDLTTGEGLNPPAEKPLRTFKVWIEDGTIFVEI